MKLLGACLILLGAGSCYLVWRQQRRAMTELCQCILQDLSVLAWGVCVCRRSMPDMVESAMAKGAAAPLFWLPLLAMLRQRELSLPACWHHAASALPDPLDRMLYPLGELLPAGGEQLAHAIEETREELSRHLRERRQQDEQQGRLAAALSLSGALTLILVLM